MPKKTKAAKLTELFYKTPEMQECKKIAGTITSKLDLGDTVSVTIKLPKEFIRLTEFLEQKRVGPDAKPLPAAKVLNRILLNELHGQLHCLVHGPARFEYYRSLWNRLCDEHGAPEEKIADPLSGPPKSGEEGPF